MSDLTRHFPDEVLRAYAIGSASEGANLAVACHSAFCLECQAAAAAHEAILGALAWTSAEPDLAAPRALRDRLLGDLPSQRPPPPARAPVALPKDLPALPTPLLRHLESLRQVAWHRLIPGIRAIDLEIGSAWSARIISFRPGIPVPLHDHDGPEHTVVFSGGLEDQHGHLGPGDAATMLPGDTHRQRISPGEPCVALVVNEGSPRPLTLMGRVLKALTRS